MSKVDILPVILCGGSGMRLWPLSRDSYPKQFLNFNSKLSIFQQTFKRVSLDNKDEVNFSAPIIVASQEHRFLIMEQVRQVSLVHSRVILEPEKKNTAAALTLAALEASKNGSDPVLIVTPSDQSIGNVNSFKKTILKAAVIAKKGDIVILGVSPKSPETGFGYIQKDSNSKNTGEYKVVNFIEKPNFELAKKLFANKNYLWNSGIFILKASVWLKAISCFRDDIFSLTKKSFEFAKNDNYFLWPAEKFFKKIPSESIDYAVIEKIPGSTFSLKTIIMDIPWNDLGSWESFRAISKKENHGNLIIGDVVVENTKNSTIYSSNRLVTVIGVDDLNIVETSDAVLISSRKSSQDIKKITKKLITQKRPEALFHRKVYRPWGWYDLIDHGKTFKVKRIMVNPGAMLSLQKHLKRTEHWVVVNGIAEVLCGAEKRILKENQSTFIPLGELHRLKNPSFDKPLEIIEIQSGSELDEDDIIRFDDNYGRT